MAAFAAAPGRFGVISIAVVTPGLDNIYRSANLGQTWTTFGIPGTGGGTPLTSLEFTSPTVASFVAGNPAIYGELMRGRRGDHVSDRWSVQLWDPALVAEVPVAMRRWLTIPGHRPAREGLTPRVISLPRRGPR